MKQVALISDFNIELLSRYLKISNKEYNFISLSYGQVFQSLLTKNKYDLAIIWTLPESISHTFNKAIQFHEVNPKKVFDEVDRFSDAVKDFSRNSESILLTSWASTGDFTGYEMQDWKEDLGIQNILSRMNLRLSNNLKDTENIYILDSQKWIVQNNYKTAAKLWYSAKIPFSNEVFLKASESFLSSINGLSGKSKKLIILDLDNTLWGGVVGETGWEGINLGGHDINGEAFVDFQSSLKGLTRKGIQLGIVSKNDEKVALEAINKHPSMILQESDFSGWKINWNDKAENVYQLVEELNLGLESVVFIDDNAAERKRVNDAFPEVLVPEWPKDVSFYRSALNELGCFYNPSISNEDRQRTSMYVEARKRKNKKSTSSKSSWLSDLNTKIKAVDLGEENISRVAQLFNKTNQLNLSTRRLTLSELKDWNSKKNNTILTFSVSDSFGDLGLVGIVGFTVKNKTGYITDFILSCRAMGREVEKSMFYIAISELKKKKITSIEAIYLPTERNRPTLDVLHDLKFKETKKNYFSIGSNLVRLKPKFTTIN